jgi:hypothetical protein
VDAPRPDRVLLHISEDATITRFVPQAPRTNATHPPAVWAIDAEHAPLYWFPRDCPRVTAWPRTPDEATAFHAAFHTTAPRLHGIELGWLPRMRTAALFAYELDSDAFRPWPAASGQWIATEAVEPLRVRPLGDLLDAHVGAGIELRVVPSLWPLHDLAVSDRWDFSIVRMANAQPRPPAASGRPP